MSATPREKEEDKKKSGGGSGGLWRWTTWERWKGKRRMRACTELATVPRIKVQADRNTSEMSVSATNSPRWQRGRKTGEMKRASPSVAPSSFIYKVFSFALMNETKDYAQLRGSPGRRRLLLLVSSCSADLRSILPWGITLDHLWDAKQERTSRWGRRGLRAEQERPLPTQHPPPQTQLITRTISCPPTQTSTLPARMPAVPASSHAASRPSHLARSCARCVCVCVQSWQLMHSRLSNISSGEDISLIHVRLKGRLRRRPGAVVTISRLARRVCHLSCSYENVPASVCENKTKHNPPPPPPLLFLLYTSIRWGTYLSH